MTYWVYNTPAVETEADLEDKIRKCGLSTDPEATTPYKMQLQFQLFCKRLGWAEFVGLLDHHTERAFYFDPRHAKRGVKELRYHNGQWVKP